MPVDDHPIHPSTQQGADFRYGCHNRKDFSIGYWAPARFVLSSGHFEMGVQWVSHQLSTSCQYDLSLTDPNCDGCQRINPELNRVKNTQANHPYPPVVQLLEEITK